MPLSRLLQPAITANLESDGAVSFFEPVRDEHSIQPLRASFSDGTWHHADVKGLAVDEYQRLVQLTSVFGDDTQIVRTPKKLGPDETWAIAYKNHTVDPFEADERGVRIVHLRPAGKKAAIKPSLKITEFLEDRGWARKPSPSQKWFMHDKYPGKLFFVNPSRSPVGDPVWQYGMSTADPSGETYAEFVVFYQELQEKGELPGKPTGKQANRRFSPAAKKIITYLKNRGWRQESDMGTGKNWYIHRGSTETFYVNPDKDIPEDEGVWLHGVDSEGPSGFTYAGFVAHYNELEEKGELPGKKPEKQAAEVDSRHRLIKFLEDRGWKRNIVAPWWLEYQGQQIYTCPEHVEETYDAEGNSPSPLWSCFPNTEGNSYGSFVLFYVEMQEKGEFPGKGEPKTSAESQSSKCVRLLEKRGFKEKAIDERYEENGWRKFMFPPNLGFDKENLPSISIKIDEEAAGARWIVYLYPEERGKFSVPGSSDRTFSSLVIFLQQFTPNPQERSGNKTSSYEPNPTYFKLLEEHGFKQAFNPQELHFYTKGPWCVLIASQKEGTDSDGAFWHEEAEAASFNSPADLQALLEEHAI
jgi:predicted RNA binding protein YcfA (HicA-like mRNA interferase family)